MSEIIESQVAQSIDEALLILGEQINEIITAGLPEQARKNNFQILRLNIPISNVHPLNWLRRSDALTRIYWRDRADKEEIATIGMTEKITVEQFENIASLFEHVKRRLDGQPEEVRYWGGFRFNPEAKMQDNRWKTVGKGQLILPRLELRRNNQGSFLGCNILIDEIPSLKPNCLTQWNDKNRIESETTEIP